MNNVHEGKPQLFQTRWAMNYLAGPLTRTQIPALNQLVGAVLPKEVAAEPAVSAAAAAPALAPAKPAAPVVKKAPARPAPSMVSSTTRPAIPTGVDEYFLPNNLTLTQAFKAANRTYPSEVKSQGLVYRPVVLAQARIRFLNRAYKLDFEQPQVALVTEPDRRGAVRWENFPAAPVDLRQLDEKPDPSARFGVLDAPFSDAKMMSAMQKDFVDWAYRTTQVTLRSNPALKLYAGPGVSQAEFRQMCADAARKGRDAELKKVSDTFEKKIDAIQAKIDREGRELEQDEAEHSQRKMEELGSAAETLIGLFGKRKSSRRISSSLTKRRMTAQSRADVQESKEAISEYENQIREIEQEKADAAEEVNQRWGDIANQVEETSLSPAKKDVLVDLFGVAWMPYHVVQIGNETIELPGYGE
jgi:hypothetical protein